MPHRCLLCLLACSATLACLAVPHLTLGQTPATSGSPANSPPAASATQPAAAESASQPAAPESPGPVDERELSAVPVELRSAFQEILALRQRQGSVLKGTLLDEGRLPFSAGGDGSETAPAATIPALTGPALTGPAVTGPAVTAAAVTAPAGGHSPPEPPAGQGSSSQKAPVAEPAGGSRSAASARSGSHGTAEPAFHEALLQAVEQDAAQRADVVAEPLSERVLPESAEPIRVGHLLAVAPADRAFPPTERSSDAQSLEAALRHASSALETQAARLERQQQYQEADRLRRLAGRLRREARSLQ